MWQNILLAFCLTLSILSAAFAYGACKIALSRVQSPRKDIEGFAHRLGIVEAMQLETDETLKVLANRVKMMRVRTAANHAVDSTSGDDKDSLRRRAGLVAGQPARHQ